MEVGLEAKTLEGVSRGLRSINVNEIIVEGDELFLEEATEYASQTSLIEEPRNWFWTILLLIATLVCSPLIMFGTLVVASDLSGQPSLKLLVPGIVTEVSDRVESYVAVELKIIREGPPPSYVVDIIWASVVVITILLLFVLFWFALRSNRDIEFSWKVSKLASGKLKITKEIKQVERKRSKSAKNETRSTAKNPRQGIE